MARCWFFLSLIILVGADKPHSEQNMVKVSGTVLGCSGKHKIHIAICDDTIFKGGNPIKKVIKKGAEANNGKMTYSFEVPKGMYTISVFEDENDNGELDMGLFGPKEPSGFFRKFTAWRAPKFEDVRFQLKQDLKGADVDID